MRQADDRGGNRKAAAPAATPTWTPVPVRVGGAAPGTPGAAAGRSGNGHGLGVAELLARPQMWGFCLTTASVEFCRGALFISLLPAYLTTVLHLSVASLGLVISVQYLSDTAFKIPAGWLVDRFGPWRVLLPFLAAAALAVYLLPHAHGLGPLLLLGVLFGLGTSANWPAVLSGSVHLGGMGSRASATSITFLAWLAGGGIGPVLINFLVGRSFDLAFGVLAVVVSAGPLAAALGLLGVLHRPGDPPWRTPTASEQREGQAVLTSIRQSAWLVPGMFVQMLALGIVLPVLVPFARTHLHLTQPQYGVLLLGGGAVTVICLLPLSRLVDRIGSKGLLVAGFALAGLAMVLVALGSGEWDLLWRVGCLGFAYALILPAWNGLTVGKIDAGRRGLLLAVFMTIEGLGQAIGPAIGGALYMRDYRLPFIVTAGILVAVSIFYLATPGRRFRASADTSGGASAHGRAPGPGPARARPTPTVAEEDDR